MFCSVRYKTFDKVKNMSQIAETNAVADVLAGLVNETAYLFGRDLDATPDDLCSCNHDGKARSVLNIAAELIGFNHMVAAILRGETVAFPSQEDRETFAATISSKDLAKAGIEESVGAVNAAIQGIAPDDWMTKITAPWGMEVTKAHLCSWVALHTMYHDGQVNFLQVLNDDTAVHWMS